MSVAYSQNYVSRILKNHYENLPVQSTEFFKVVKNENFQ